MREDGYRREVSSADFELMWRNHNRDDDMNYSRAVERIVQVLGSIAFVLVCIMILVSV